MLSDSKARLYALTSVFFWSTIATASKLSLSMVSPFQIIIIATWVSVLFFLISITIEKKWGLVFQTTAKQWGISFVAGLLNPISYYFILFNAYNLLPAQIAQTLNYVWPITLSLLAVPLLKQKLHSFQLVALMICLLGIVIIATQGELTSMKLNNPLGISLALGSSIVWALYWILVKFDNRDESVKLFQSFLLASVMLTLIGYYTHSLPEVSIQTYSGGIYIGIFEMGFTFLLWSTAMKLTNEPAFISKFIYLSPFLSMVFIYFILEETIFYTTFLGLFVIIVGIFYEERNRLSKS